MLNRDGEEIPGRTVGMGGGRRLLTTSAGRDPFELRLNLPVRRLAALLYGIVLVLLALSLFFALFDRQFPEAVGGGWLRRVTDLGEEANIPTLFSVGLLLLASCLSFLIARAERLAGPVPPGLASWRLLGLLLFLMAADEFLMLHETANGLLERAWTISGVYMWIIPGALVVLWFIILFLKFFRSLPGVVRRLLVLSLALFVGGAIGVEIFEGLNLSFTQEPEVRAILLTNTQETLEMVGEVVLLQALLTYIRDFLGYRRTQLALHFGD